MRSRSRIRSNTFLAAAFLALAFAAYAGSIAQGFSPQDPPPPAQGRGRGPNFPQQQRPPGDPAVIARGRGLYGVNCTGCHGPDLRGGDMGGPNLLRSEVVLTDEKGEKIGAVVRNGRRGPAGAMPAVQIPDEDINAIAEYIHSVMGQAGRQGRPPERETPFELNVLVGDPGPGEVYFARVCSRCHSTTGDLRGIAARVNDPRALQNLWVSGGASARTDADERRLTVTVTVPGSAPVTGKLVRVDDFIVSLELEEDVRRTFARNGAVPKVEIKDPQEPHRRLVLELTDRDMHNVTAYLATLK